eukprot:TRINITY_DN15602_c0_g1_i1.p1 TRINITY_DN15602_c0_g1~~TRINITY_DN15602_c0_g1_i1.p1  ORF type:complete len:362 (-),score=70.84 TRINITY_DN15602_c0_g1_i1:169-1254(-)
MALPRASNMISDDDQIMGIFVVRFDTYKGNMIEWNLPQNMVTTNLEFKALASGLHNVKNDFIYFKLQDLYGVSCYEKKAVDNSQERGSRMRSVGVLCRSFSSLHRHLDFLREQARYQTEHSGDYTNLIEYYNNQKSIQIDHFSPLEDYIEIPQLSSDFERFIQEYGNKVFMLWKAVLLKKRILFYSPPPIGKACFTVYCCCLLSAISKPYVWDTSPTPLFYVNIADIDLLCTMKSYIACTTESIFSDKKRLYDVYINGTEITIPDDHLASLLQGTVVEDEYRWGKIRTLMASSRSDVSKSPFLSLNDSLFESMVTHSRRSSKVGKTEMISQFQISNGELFNALTEQYNIDLAYAPTFCESC